MTQESPKTPYPGKSLNLEAASVSPGATGLVMIKLKPTAKSWSSRGSQAAIEISLIDRNGGFFRWIFRDSKRILM